jgi:hypothetical protein
MQGQVARVVEKLSDMIICNEIACCAVVGTFIIRTETELPSAKLSLRFLQLSNDNVIVLHETWVTTDTYSYFILAISTLYYRV